MRHISLWLTLPPNEFHTKSAKLHFKKKRKKVYCQHVMTLKARSDMSARRWCWYVWISPSCLRADDAPTTPHWTTSRGKQTVLVANDNITCLNGGITFHFRGEIKDILGALPVDSHVLYFVPKMLLLYQHVLLGVHASVQLRHLVVKGFFCSFPLTAPSDVVALWEVFPLTLFSMCVLKRGLPTRECWLTSSTACWVKRPELQEAQEAQEVEQLEPAYRVLPRKQVQPPFPLLSLKSFCC